MSNSVEPAPEGTTFTAAGHEQIVAPKCGTNVGTWFCITHLRGFTNQMEKDSHIHRGDHVLAWMCWEHGPEVP
jgi:hypothetical protein